ncbi:MAG: YraN family protein [Actinomycetota bacterium]
MEAVPRARTGSIGEDAALRTYTDAGYRLIARNWRCRIGELDLVLVRGPTLVFCEVKSRRGAAFGGGWEAVTARKQAKVRAVAQAFLLANHVQPDEIRFDVASVLIGRGPGAVTVELFPDAF